MHILSHYIEDSYVSVNPFIFILAVHNDYCFYCYILYLHLLYTLPSIYLFHWCRFEQILLSYPI